MKVKIDICENIFVFELDERIKISSLVKEIERTIEEQNEKVNSKKKTSKLFDQDFWDNEVF